MKGVNINLDFNDENEDMWVRTREDRAGDRRMMLRDLERLCEMQDIIIGYRSEGKVLKCKIGTGSIRDIASQIRLKADEWGMIFHVWGSRAGNVIEIEDIENEV